MQNVPVRVAGRAGKADDIAALIDGSRRIPEFSAQIAKIGRSAVLPEDGVLGGVPPDRLIADTRDTDGLSRIVDRGRGAGGVASDKREFVDPVMPVGVPEDRAKLQDLGRDASVIVAGILRPTDHDTRVICSGGKAVISTEGGKRSHLPVLPDESEVDETDIVRQRVEQCAAPIFAERFGCVRLRNPSDEVSSVFDVKSYRAVPLRFAERAEVEDGAGTPESCMADLVACQIGIAGHPIAIVDAVSPAICSVKRTEIGYLVLLGLGLRLRRLILREDQSGCAD